VLGKRVPRRGGGNRKMGKIFIMWSFIILLISVGQAGHVARMEEMLNPYKS
jgi:hypothetical protein